MKFVRIIKFYAKIESDNSAKAGRYICSITTIQLPMIISHKRPKSPNKQKFDGKICDYFLTQQFKHCFGCSKEPSH